MEANCYVPHLHSSFSSAPGPSSSFSGPYAPPLLSGDTPGESSWRVGSPPPMIKRSVQDNHPSSSSSPISSLPSTTSMRACVDMEMTGTFPVPSMEMDPLSNIFGLPPSCAPAPYKELSLTKEKEGHGVADALLSLKHAVVHPSQMAGQLSPLSPTLAHHFSTQGPSAPHSMHPHNTSFYHQHHHQSSAPPSSHLGGYPSGCSPYSSNPYPEQPTPGSQGSPTHGQTPANMFPSMSVNVSMSMNVGMGPLNTNLPQPHISSDQWTTVPPPSQYSPGQGLHQHQSHSNQYPPGYSVQNQSYSSSYSFSADLRSPGFPSKDMIYKSPSASDYKPMPKFYNFSALNMRRKAPTGRPGVDNSKVNLCRICGKTYARPSTLKTHMRTHSGEKPYRCSTCTKSFSQAANLTAHIRTHSGEKPFRCLVCERRFSQSSSVTTHMRTHSGERPYRCRMCKKAFSDSSTLTKHLRIHSGEKPYQCKLCLLRFSQSGNLNRHMRVHSNNS